MLLLASTKSLSVSTQAVQHVLSLTHDHIDVGNDGLQYRGRWLTSFNRLEKHASFPGVSIEFTVTNTTHVILDLANQAIRSEARDTSTEKSKSSLVLTPKSGKSKISGPVKLLVNIDSAQLRTKYELNAYNPTLVCAKLDRDAEYKIRIVLKSSRNTDTMQFRGLWISQGGTLADPSGTQAQEKNLMHNLVEVVAPTSLLQLNESTGWAGLPPRSWFDMVEQQFPNTTLSVIPVAEQACITKQHHQKTASTSEAPDKVFFRAGLPGTSLYDRFWLFDSVGAKSSALVLILGLADVQAFLDAGNLSKQAAQNFIEDFSSAYAKFVQTVRRTAYSQSSSADKQMIFSTDSLSDTDESYLYNSAPSIIPVFLVIPPVPSLLQNCLQARLLLSHATNKVLDHLKYHIGDKKTFVIDTAGWLDSEDFEIDLSNEVNLLNTSLSRSGHVKFAYHLSAHLCHYLIDRGRRGGAEECPFDRHEEYTGNLYVPDAANVGKLIEERKIAMVKELLGFA